MDRLHKCREPLRASVQSRLLRGEGDEGRSLRIVHISDTHCRNYDVPDGDILIHSGDFTNNGAQEDLQEVQHFVPYFQSLPHRYKVLVPGNHELGLDQIPLEDLRRLLGCTPESNCFLLVDESVTIEGIKIYGSPWTACTMAWAATSEEQRARKWERIPHDTDILVTHMPPYKIYDLAWQPDGKYYHWGCRALLQRVHEVAPSLHCFGHVHDEVGCKLQPTACGETMFSNAAMDLRPQPNVFDFAICLEPTAGFAAKEAVPQVGYLQVKGSDLVLDLDAADPNQQQVFLWKKLAVPRANQLWQLSPAGAAHAAASLANQQRFLRISKAGLSAADTPQPCLMKEHEDWILAHGGDAVNAPERGVGNGRFLEVYPGSALPFHFVPIPC